MSKHVLEFCLTDWCGSGERAARWGERVGYQRVSTVGQNTDRQLDGIAIDKMFTDKASGKDVHRPELARAIEYLRQGDTWWCIPWIG